MSQANANPFLAPGEESEPPLQTRPSTGKRVALWIVASLVFGILLIGLLSPLMRFGVPEAARRSKCQNNLKQISLAMLNYESSYGKLPPAYTVDENGAPLHSWRVLILPQLGELELYGSIDLTKPWNDSVNEHARKQVPDCYRCPSTRAPQGYTTYVANAWEGGAFVPGKGMTSNFPDGASNTILAFEVSEELAVEWMSPVDGDYQTLLKVFESARLPHGEVINAAFADGSTHSLRNPSKLKAGFYLPLFTVNAGDNAELE